MSVANPSSFVGVTGSGQPVYLAPTKSQPPVATRFGNGRKGNPGGRMPLGTSSLRRRMRDAFKEGVDRNLCDQAISIARGEAVEDLVKSMCAAADRGGENCDKILRALGSTLVSTLSTQLAAIEFCKRVGFGADPKPMDQSAVLELVASMLNEARARAAEKAALAAQATTGESTK